MLLAVVAGLVALGAVAALSVRGPGQDEAAQPGREHARSACDLTTKAQEAAGGGSDARYAAAVLLLDQAILASARAARESDRFDDLDRAVQAAHTAGHQGRGDAWEAALDEALADCREVDSPG